MAENNQNQLITRQDDLVLNAVGERLVKADSPQEIILWTQVRGEILRQNEEREEKKHQRQLERIQFYSKLFLSIVAIVVGILLLSWGYTVAGLFSLGAGLFWLAPDLVKSVFEQFKPKA